MNPSETDPLMNSELPSSRKYNAHPYWLVPVVVFASMARGMSLAPRIQERGEIVFPNCKADTLNTQVFKDIACKAVTTSAPNLADACATPAVQERAAAIQAMVITVMSILSAITTGPWSRYGDVNGRKPVLVLALFGALSMELMLILVINTTNLFTSYTFVAIGAILDGSVGGLAVFNGVIHAYTSDCTAHGSRAKIFSTLQGMVFVGLALGPWAGGFVVSAFNQSVYLLFYLSAGLVSLLLIFVIFVLPESLENAPLRPQPTDSVSRFRRHIRNLGSSLVAPITIFMPKPPLEERYGKRDYNVTFVGAALFIYLISIGVYQIKYLYATHVYQWSATELGKYMSLLWITRAINLLVILPMIIAYFKPKATGSDRPSIVSEMRFDNILARCSLFVDGTADFLVAITPATSAIPFVVFSCLSSLTSGGNPAMHSLGAVCLHAAGRSSEVGSLFGAFAVLSAMAHTISPTLYAVLYAFTVENYPGAIFVLATILLMTTVALLSALKSDQPSVSYLPLAEEEPEDSSHDS